LLSPGGILTVADDLLKNDGKKFLDMMERLAERRMQRDDEADMDQDEEYYDEDEDDDDIYDDENEEVRQKVTCFCLVTNLCNTPVTPIGYSNRRTAYGGRPSNVPDLCR
jgi:hypothetical protein